MFRHLQRLSIGYYARVQSGDVVARFTSDLADIQKSLTTRVVDAVVAMLGLIINVPVAFMIDWRLATGDGAGHADGGPRHARVRTARQRRALRAQAGRGGHREHGGRVGPRAARGQGVRPGRVADGAVREAAGRPGPPIRPRRVPGGARRQLVELRRPHGAGRRARRRRLDGVFQQPDDRLARRVPQPARRRQQGRVRPDQEGHPRADLLVRRPAADRGAARRTRGRRRRRRRADAEPGRRARWRSRA